MKLNNKRFLIVGLGKTGIETLKFLKSKGGLVRATDISALEQLSEEVKELIDAGYEIETGSHSEENLVWADVVIPSPGVSFNTPFIQKAIELEKEVISEIELAYRFLKKPIIAVTGSNGKTTTTSIIAQILKRNGKNIFLGGNIGTPLITIAEKDGNLDYLVLELSSFQLQGTKNFKPFIALLLNISPNHLDHHSNFDEYFYSKMKIFSNQTENEWAILNLNDKKIKEFSKNLEAKKIGFGNNSSQDEITLRNDEVYFRNEVYNLKGIKLIGKHNLENAMYAIAATKILGCEKDKTVEAIVNFNPLPHRIEYIGTINGVKIYNDSKSTSPGATLKALESLNQPIILLAGGKDKGISYEILRDTINKKVKHLILFGESKLRMKKQVAKCVPATLADSLEEAVKSALSNSKENDSLLFSPACSSFDMFKSYEERGREFKKIVENL